MMDVLMTDRINPQTKQPINLQLDAGDVSGKKGGFQLNGAIYCMPIGNVNYTRVSDRLCL